MLLIKLFRLKNKKTIHFFLWILLFSFGLQTSQDILTRLGAVENINNNLTTLNKSTKAFNQVNIIDDDQDVSDHHHLDIPQLFYHPLFDYNFLSFNDILDQRTNQFYDDQTLAASTRLFLFNRTLII